MRRFSKAVLIASTVALLTVTACSSSDDSKSSSEDGRGPITYVEGKDTTENQVVRQLVEKWNADHPDEKVTFKEQSNDASQQHDDFVQHLQAKQSDYDLLAIDVIWTAEFAARGWLVPLKDSFALDTTALLPATVASGTYNSTLYAAPKNTNAGLLFYRKDLVPEAPKTWAELIGACPIAKQNNIACYAGQYAPYEGLTVNTAEAINSHGGTFVGADGKTPTIDSPQSRAGLQQLVDAFGAGDIPAEAITFKEPESQSAFIDGKLLFMRNWPGVWGPASADTSSVKDKFAVTSLPGPNGVGASTLGGYNVGINAFSKHKATALDFLRFIVSEPAQRLIAESARPPVLARLYDDPALATQMPYLPALKASVSGAVPRPVTPFYPAVSKAVQDNAYAALKREKSVDQAITDMQKGIESAGK